MRSWGGCNLPMTIGTPYNNRKQLKIYKEKKGWGDCNLPVTIKIPYNNGIWRIWVNGGIHSNGNRVTPEFKEMFNKCQLVNK